MADETPGTTTGQTTVSDAPAEPPTAVPPTTGEPAAPIPPAEPPQDNAGFAAARREEAAKRKAAEDRAAAAEAELQTLRDEKAAAEREKMDATERAQLEAKEAREAREAAEAKLAAAELGRIRADLIAADPDAAKLPPEFKAVITGDSEAALQESIVAAKTRYAEVEAAIIASATGKPPSLGTASNVPGGQGQPPPEFDPKNPTDEAWRKERARRGYPSR
jgi:cell wall-associated NlpC family hydrolase